MPRNAHVDVGQVPVQLTANDVAGGMFIHNEGPGSIRIAGSPTASTTPTMSGPVLGPDAAISAAVALVDIFPGVEGVVRVYAVAAGPTPARVFVSHA